MNLLLFDIDGTLISTGGAALRAADLAFENIYGVKNVMANITADGKTDYLILNEMFQNGLGRGYTAQESEVIFNEYLRILDKDLNNGGNITVLPGVVDLLDRLVDKNDVVLGLATGNIERGAWTKLKHCGLDRYFSFGGFGSDAQQRETLVRAGIERGRRAADRHLYNIYVIGDTPRDIIAGKAAGASTVGVSTGVYSYKQLESHNPEYLFNDFSNIDSFLNILQ
ncbi:MAG: HAD hydrolase-like protein [Candidatus Dadabacteria bacterium]|nr:HAD hydrolase-like protein [Candidatus Dadabacteria bacterium]NIS07441.1 HAD hydrolase-like protein [Candidatus Dadabacteria bacterium]NIY21093.1 HAD hydrolase-like protein [Candidatus Dadabacteria bacterium]